MTQRASQGHHISGLGKVHIAYRKSKEMEKTYLHPGSVRTDSGTRPGLDHQIKGSSGCRCGKILEKRPTGYEMLKILQCTLWSIREITQ